MSDQDQQLSDAEKMRLKRLARLGGTTNSPSTQPSSTTTDRAPEVQEATTPREPPSAGSRLLNIKADHLEPSSQAGPSSSSPTPKAVKPIKAPSPSPGLLGKRPSSAATPARASQPPLEVPRATAPPARLSIPYPEWEAQRVQAVFSVTLKRGDAERSDWRLCWLKDLQLEIESETSVQNTSIVTSADLADRLLIARLSLDIGAMASSSDTDILTILAGLPQGETTFEYLAGCWKRLNLANREANRLALDQNDRQSWHATADKLKGLIISYIGMTLEDPTMFPQPENKPLGPAEFLPLLLSLTPTNSSTNGDPLTTGLSGPGPTLPVPLSPGDLLPFLNDLAAGFTQEMLADVLTPTLSLFFQEWFKITPTPDLLGDDWRRFLGAVSLLTQVKGIAAALPSLGVWLAQSADAPRIEWQSLLGPLARLSVYPREFAEIWKTYFSNPTERNVKDIDANKDNLRHTLGGLQTSLFNIFNAIVRASPQSREQVLDFFAHVVRSNKKRAGMRVDHRTVSSDGFMTNLQVVLLKLFEPVMDASFSKIDKVDPRYFQATTRVDIEDETKVKATKEEADEYYAKDESNPKPIPNFISDLFFLLNAFQHIGLNKTIGNRSTAERNLSDVEKELKRTEASSGDWEGNPQLQAQGEAAIKKLKADLSTLHASIHAYDTQLLDPALTRLNLTFVGFLMTWLVRQVDPAHQFPKVNLSLPLPKESSLDFKMLPEYLFDNVAEYFEFLSRYRAEALDDGDKDILITFTIVFLSPGYVNNPFMKAKLVHGLSNGLIPQGYWRKGPLFDRLDIHPLSTQYLMPTLIRFFIDVEMTGGHTQFWDKFNYRRDISRIIKAMWSNPLHREAFIKSRHDDFDQFIRFTNMLMSDTTFHLEESLTGLAKINSIETRRANTQAWNAMDQAERDDLAADLRQAESSTPFHTVMGLDHVELMRDLTATTREPFITGEIVDRLAATLNENLTTLVGPKMSDLKVADPDRFSFKPKRLLAALAQVYINLAVEGDFVRAVANDGRSYSKDLFERFARTLKNRAIMTDAEVAGVVAFAQKVEDMRATILMEDEREIPDEFLDPLMSTLMKDPVILPVSRVVIDRATIRTVLLSKELDPFNNVPLKYEQLIPDTELKAKIDAWLAGGDTAPADDVMDVDQL